MVELKWKYLGTYEIEVTDCGDDVGLLIKLEAIDNISENNSAAQIENTAAQIVPWDKVRELAEFITRISKNRERKQKVSNFRNDRARTT